MFLLQFTFLIFFRNKKWKLTICKVTFLVCQRNLHYIYIHMPTEHTLISTSRFVFRHTFLYQPWRTATAWTWIEENGSYVRWCAICSAFTSKKSTWRFLTSIQIGPLLCHLILSIYWMVGSVRCDIWLVHTHFWLMSNDRDFFCYLLSFQFYVLVELTFLSWIYGQCWLDPTWTMRSCALNRCFVVKKHFGSCALLIHYSKSL